MKYFWTLNTVPRIYAVGGRSNDKTYLRSMEFYDPSTGQWSMCKPMETCRYFFRFAPIYWNLKHIQGFQIENVLNKPFQMLF